MKTRIYLLGFQASICHIFATESDSMGYMFWVANDRVFCGEVLWNRQVITDSLVASCLHSATTDTRAHTSVKICRKSRKNKNMYRKCKLPQAVSAIECVGFRQDWRHEPIPASICPTNIQHLL